MRVTLKGGSGLKNSRDGTHLPMGWTTFTSIDVVMSFINSRAHAIRTYMASRIYIMGVLLIALCELKILAQRACS